MKHADPHSPAPLGREAGFFRLPQISGGAPGADDPRLAGAARPSPAQEAAQRFLRQNFPRQERLGVFGGPVQLYRGLSTTPRLLWAAASCAFLGGNYSSRITQRLTKEQLCAALSPGLQGDLYTLGVALGTAGCALPAMLAAGYALSLS